MISDKDLKNLKYGFLRQRQSLPLAAKIILTKRRIRAAYDFAEGLIYVSYSGGKDSLVLLDIVRSLYPDTPAVFVDTGLEYPEVRKAGRSAENVVILKPEMSFKDVLKKHGYPIISKRNAQYIREVRTGINNAATKRLRLTGIRSDGSFSGYARITKKWQYLINAPFPISERCCDVMKKRPVRKYGKETGRLPIIGVMVDEGLGRELSYLQHGCNAFHFKTPASMPMAVWTKNDVLQYVLDRSLELPKVYGEIVEVDGKLKTTGVERTGCIFCAFGAQLESSPNRFQSLHDSHPKYHTYGMKQLGMEEVLRYIGVDPYPERTLFDDITETVNG